MQDWRRTVASCQGHNGTGSAHRDTDNAAVEGGATVVIRKTALIQSWTVASPSTAAL